MTWPVEAGGGGRSPLERFVVFEALIGEGAPLATSWFADRQMGPTLLQFGTPEQQRAHLPAILDGTSAWSIGMSEPDAGSDVASIRTRAVRDGDDFVVNGQKIWNSGAADGRLDLPDRPHRPRRAAARRAVGAHRRHALARASRSRPIRDMTGNDHFCEVFFEDVRVPAANLVGELNGSFRQVMRQMEHERGGIDRLLSNRKLYVDVPAPRRHRRPAGPPGDRGHRDAATASGASWCCARCLGQAPKQFSAATKTFCTELEQRIAVVLRVGAGAGGDARRAGPAARVSRNVAYAPAYTIMGGTTQILRNILGERVLGPPPLTALDPAHRWTSGRARSRATRGHRLRDHRRCRRGR